MVITKNDIKKNANAYLENHKKELIKNMGCEKGGAAHASSATELIEFCSICHGKMIIICPICVKYGLKNKLSNTLRNTSNQYVSYFRKHLKIRNHVVPVHNDVNGIQENDSSELPPFEVSFDVYPHPTVINQIATNTFHITYFGCTSFVGQKVCEHMLEVYHKVDSGNILMPLGKTEYDNFCILLFPELESIQGATRCNVPEIQSFFIDITTAIYDLHKTGYCHNNITPANIVTCNDFFLVCFPYKY
jgi:thiamine kinase-like enzyme